MNKKYLSLVLIVFGSILVTLISFNIGNFLRKYIIPLYDNYYMNCYELFVNIGTVNNKLFYIDLFYISYFIIYIILFIFVLIKILKIKNMENIYTTVIILTIFNAILLSSFFYSKVEIRKISISYCDFIKSTCHTSYQILHNIHGSSKISIPFEKLKPCITDYETYGKKVKKVLDERIKKFKENSK